MQDDVVDRLTKADHVRGILDTIDEPVVLVGHSYGGMVLTELADHPKVGHGVYLTAMWPRRGQSLLDTFGGALPPSVVQRPDGALQVTDDFDVAWASIGQGFERVAAKQMMARLVLQSAASANVPSTAPDCAHPTTYMVAGQEDDGAANAGHVVRLPGTHMLMLSHPNEVAGALLSVSIG